MSNTVTEWSDRFAAACGDPEAGAWATRLRMKMMLAGVPKDACDRVLAEALLQVEQQRTSPVELFGPADRHVTDVVAELNMDGVRFVGTEITHRGMLSLGFAAAAMFALAFGILDRIEGSSREWSLGDVVGLVLLVVAAVVWSMVSQRLSRHRSQLVATFAGAIAAVPVLVAIPFIGHWHVSWGVHSTLWWFALAAGFALLSFLTTKIFPEQSPHVIEVNDDADWLEQAELAMRHRDDLSGAQVRDRLAEARAHALASGNSLVDEFGDPRGYANSLPRQASVGVRNGAIVMTINVVVLAVIAASGGFEPWSLAVLALAVIGCVLIWVAWFQSKRRQ